MSPNPALKPPVSVEAYLQGELETDVKHEYLAGEVVAMGGASRSQGLIATALALAIGPQARDKGCQLFIADMKVRIEHDDERYFYYPDLLVTCDRDDRERLRRRERRARGTVCRRALKRRRALPQMRTTSDIAASERAQRGR